jgi:hypothetical protein
LARGDAMLRAEQPSLAAIDFFVPGTASSRSKGDLMRWTWWCLVPMLAPACDAQAPGDYPCEPLATIRGTVRNEATSPPPSAELVLRWHHETEADVDEPVYEAIEVDGVFPASFSLDIFVPPPEQTFGHLDGPDDSPSQHRVALAVIEIYPEGTTRYVRENAISWEERHFVQYAPDDVPGDQVELGLDIPRGFSLIEHGPEGAQVSSSDTPLEIRLVDDAGELHDPLDDV